MAERIRILENRVAEAISPNGPNAEVNTREQTAVVDWNAGRVLDGATRPDDPIGPQGYDENDVNLVPALMTLTRGRTRQDGTNSGGGTVSIAERYRAMMDPFGALPRQHTDTHATPPQGNSGNHSPDEVLVDQGQGSSPGSSARAPRSLGGAMRADDQDMEMGPA
ncbi:uncharacterized protein PGTG_20824 [Puccinia graminis f. sp. tritici CRL 75-36-700-3]|uniref:Uncharacterized protein n=2 Tax=Puccinia graminis f. sp. tritici TaxID=56615 RepID=H6QPM5_PUCGT|nr:uncharacterized protein PGTG_20824 [Puccinia graminis f. sp. tritici CRL 75-36-700-3]EHS64127.1 hypothetical protein PGTG_20824 [Puccinia graminis f. sp. tritici CRL 75-36-700-3]